MLHAPSAKRTFSITSPVSSSDNGYEPSYTQIARHFGVKSRATIAKHIAALERRGLLVRQHEDGKFGLNVTVSDNTSEALCEVKLLEGSQPAIRWKSLNTKSAFPYLAFCLAESVQSAFMPLKS